MFGGDGGQRLVGEDTLASLGKRTPAFHLHAELGHERLGGALLEERMVLHLVHGGNNLVVHNEVEQAHRLEVRHADGAHAALAIQLLNRAPRTVVVVERLVDKVKVQVV